MCSYFTGGNVACAATLRTRRGQPGGFPLLANQPLSLRARCARKSKCSFPIAAHFPYQGKQNGCHPRGAGAQCAPLRQAERCVPVGGVLPFLLLLESGRRKVWRYAPRARCAPLFAAANAANLRVGLNCLLSPKRKWGDSQEGRNFVSPLLCARRAQRHFLPVINWHTRIIRVSGTNGAKGPPSRRPLRTQRYRSPGAQCAPLRPRRI